MGAVRICGPVAALFLVTTSICQAKQPVRQVGMHDSATIFESPFNSEATATINKSVVASLAQKEIKNYWKFEPAKQTALDTSLIAQSPRIHTGNDIRRDVENPCDSLQDEFGSNDNLVVDSSFECQALLPDATYPWTLIGNGFESDENEFYFGVASARVSVLPGDWGGMSQTIIFTEPSQRPLFMRTYAMFDENAFPFGSENPDARTLQVILTYVDGKVMSYNQTFEGVPHSWIWVSASRTIYPELPVTSVAIQCVYENDHTLSEDEEIRNATAWFDSLWLSFLPERSQSSMTEAQTSTVVDNPSESVQTTASEAMLRSTPTTESDANDGEGHSLSTMTLAFIVAACTLTGTTLSLAGLYRYRIYRHAQQTALPQHIGPDFMPHKPRKLKDYLLDRRSLYSVGTTLSERLAQWMETLGRREQQTREPQPVPEDNDS